MAKVYTNERRGLMDNKFLALDSALITILNMNIGKEYRLKELAKIEEYAKGLVHLSQDKKIELEAVIEAFKAELNNTTISEECIGGYYRILKEMLSVRRGFKGQKCIIYGDNWLAEEIEKKMLSKNYSAFNWRVVNPDYVNEYDLYILCDEPLKTYDLQAISDKAKIIKIWDYLKYKFVVFPSFYKIYMDFKKNSSDKVKCIVTGNTNIVSAVHSNMLHVKSVSLANNAQDIYYDFKMFCHAYEAMPNVEYAIIGLAPYSLRYDASKSKVEWRRCLVYYPIVESMHNCEDKEHLISIFESEDKKIKEYFDEEYMQSLYDLFEQAGTGVGVEEDGVYNEATLSQETAALNIREISELYNRPYMDIFLENKVLIEEYAHFCQMKGIKTIFLIPPYTQWYRDHMKKSYYDELVAALKVLCTKYNAQLVDMTDVSLPDCCFKDYANVNHIGAVKVASYLNAIFESES